jgi:phospholipase C
MADAFMPQVKNIVFLMLENRALDNLLGWLYTPTSIWRCPSRPLNVYPKGSSTAYDGLTAGMYANPDSNGTAVPIIPVSDQVWSSGYAVPYRDPYEALRAGKDQDPRDPDDNWKGVMNQFFGNQNIITGLPSKGDGQPAMKGFLQDYCSFDDGSWKGHDILWTYTPFQANVMNSIALKYAVSDRWFCSVPSETNPNRAYSICGTSQGRESNQHWNSEEQFALPTIFNAIGPQKSWGIYFTDKWVGRRSYTDYTFENIAKAPNGEIDNISTFFSRARDGTLRAFTYLEPTWTSLWSDGNDYHPNAHIAPGEFFLHSVYDAVRNGPQWSNTLFIVIFDEHGGTYDHVPPPWGAQNPDGLNGVENGFKFDLFGARVPSILVSPFVPQSMVFRAPEEDIEKGKYPFDHTSFTKTLLKWAGVYESQAASFGKRMLNAQTFEGVLADHPVNDGIVNFSGPQAMEPPVLESPRQVHPAGTRVELRELLKGIPVVPARTILETNKTREEVRTAVERYRRDPKTYETWLKTNARGRRG